MEPAVRALLKTCGTTYASQARITLADKPSPMYRLLVLTVLLSHRIQADIAVTAARELFRAGYTSPRRMRDATWQQRVDALGRGHFVRYDESTATTLGDGAALLLDAYHGDVRRIRREADGDIRALRRGLQRVKGVGPTGADIFCREAQAVWPELRPYLDRRALKGAERLGLPTDPEKLADLVPGDRLAALSAALVRVSLDRDLVAQVTDRR